jgi:chemotaxis protein MotD
VRVLVLQLHPAELGGVTLRIALKGNALDLQIEADKGQTARLLNDDREALSSLLRTAGYAVDTVTVRAVEVSPAASQVGASSGSGVGDPQPQFRGSQPDVGHSRGQEQGQDRNHQRPNRIGNEGQDTSHTGSGDGIYV